MVVKFLFIAMIFFFAYGAVTISQKRAISPEPIIFEVIIHEPCENYLNATLDSIQISRIQSNPTCLPINPTNPAVDVNDYHAHILCTNIHGGRSVFKFHEIFLITEDETPEPGAQFIVSWVVPHRFREAKNEYTYLRRPRCSIINDTCTTRQIVNDCWDNRVDLDNTFVDSRDRVYMIPPGVTVGTCYLNNSCCPYISLSNLGICGGNAPDLCQAANCDDNDPCTIDSCNPLNGTCCHTPINCDDGFRCTDDTCVAGVCQNTPRVCNSTNYCDVNARCDNATGNCIFDERDCNDTNICTTGDFCNRATGACDITGFLTCPPPPNNCTYLNCEPTQGCVLRDLTCGDDNTCTRDTCVLPQGNCQRVTFCDAPIFCRLGSCIPNRCTPGLPCPEDNGNQTVAEYCTSSDLCTALRADLSCNQALNCCANSLGVCRCPTGQLTGCAP